MTLKTTKNLAQSDVEISAGRHTLKGTLSRPAGSHAGVVFAHGSGSGRGTPRAPGRRGPRRPGGRKTLPRSFHAAGDRTWPATAWPTSRLRLC